MVKISFIGAGRMNSAIIKGILSGKKFRASQINCTAGKNNSGPNLSKETGIGYEKCKNNLTKESSYVVLGVKP
jgi:pyrroline-5-carboxylate reductase